MNQQERTSKQITIIDTLMRFADSKMTIHRKEFHRLSSDIVDALTPLIPESKEEKKGDWYSQIADKHSGETIKMIIEKREKLESSLKESQERVHELQIGLRNVLTDMVDLGRIKRNVLKAAESLLSNGADKVAAVPQETKEPSRLSDEDMNDIAAKMYNTQSLHHHGEVFKAVNRDAQRFIHGMKEARKFYEVHRGGKTEGWITDRLPEDGQEVLLSLQSKANGMARTGVGHQYDGSYGRVTEGIYHIRGWQPLPAPLPSEPVGN